MKRVVRYALYILVFMIIISLFNFWINTHPPKFRGKETPEKYGLSYEPVRFKTNDGLLLAGWLIKGKPGSPTVIVGHGYPYDKSNVLGVARFLHPEFSLFLFDFRSFGESEGSVTTAGAKEIEDFNAAIRYLKSRNDINHVFGAYGFSLSAATFIMAEHPEIKAIVADSAYASIRDVIGQFYWYLGPFKEPLVWLTVLYGRFFYGIDALQYSAEASIRRLTIPVLLIHGRNDFQIPLIHSQRLHDAGNKEIIELWIVETADHGMSYAVDPAAYEAKVKGFFDEHLAR